MISYSVTFEDCECGCHFLNSLQDDSMKTDHCILKRIFNSVKRFNFSNGN